MADNKKENERLIKAWEKASQDLTIQIETPFILTTDNKNLRYDLLIKNFGSKKGTLIVTTDNRSEFHSPSEFGFYCSALNPFYYNHYDRERFIETLTDWGYFGLPVNKPEWYEGHIYNNE